MNIKTVTYSKSYEMVLPFGLKVWEKIGVEAELTEEESSDVQGSLKLLKDQVETFHKENNKETDRTFEEPVIQVGKQPVKLDPDASIIAQYKKAVLDENEAKVTLMETIYNNEKLKDAIKE